MTDTTPTVDIYPSPVKGQDYLAVFNFNSKSEPLPEPLNVTPPKLKTIIILDQSGSMGQWVTRTCQEILPKVFAQLDYAADEEIDLILFESNTTHQVHKVREFPTLPYRSCGGTYMTPVFPILKQLFQTADPSVPTHFRILTISDGEVCSQESTVAAASIFYEEILANFAHITVSSSAIRLFTWSHADPDTRALSSVLQFNTSTNTPKLLDINPLDPRYEGQTNLAIEDCAKTICQGIGNALPKAYLGLENIYPSLLPETDDRCMFKSQPWGTSSAFVPIGEKKVLFWLDAKRFNKDALPKITLCDSIEVIPTLHEKLDSETYEALIASRIEYYMMQVKLLVVVGTESSQKNLKKIADYFISLETSLFSEFDQTEQNAIVMDDSDSSASTSALVYKHRINDLKLKYSKLNSTLRVRMQELMNIDRHAGFNSAQAADFLRQTGSSKSAKNLARRHGADLDFTAILRDEVLSLARALNDFETTLPPDFEDKLPESFVSLANTMDGLRAICSLATTSAIGQEIPLQISGEEDPNAPTSILESLSDVEILSFFNLVGIPCQGTIGDYPDPYRYNINVIFSGHYCSISDLITHAQLYSNDASETPAQLCIPGYKGDSGRIDNVIPILPSCLFQFIYTHAPHVLQYYASIGMRRVIADIPGTLPATLSTSLLKMMKIVSTEPNEVNMTALVNLYQGLQATSTVRFNQPQFDELFHAIHNAAAIEQTTNAPVTQTLVEEDMVQLTPAPVSPTGKFLPAITQSLSQMLLPILHVYRLVAQHDQGIKVSAMGKHAANILSTHPSTEMSPEALEAEIELVKKHLPTVFRALYANEVWGAVRSQYNGKPDKMKIIEEGLHSLIGFTKTFLPELTPDYQDDIEFDPKIHEPQQCANFYQSTSFKDLQKRLNKFNILFALPQFGELFAAIEAGKNMTELVNMAKQTIPQLLSSLETVNQIQEHNSFNATNLDDDDTWSEDENDEPMVSKQAKDDYFERRRGQVAMAEAALLTALPRTSFGLTATTQPSEILPAHFAHLKLVNIIYAYKYADSDARFTPVAQVENNDLAWGPSSMEKQTQVYTSNIPDYTFSTTSPAECAILSSFDGLRRDLYKSLYQSAVSSKNSRLLAESGSQYVNKLVAEDSVDAFISLLQNGIEFGPKFSYSFKKQGHQDPAFHILWKKLVTDEEVPSRLKKLRYIILGVTETGDIVWNQGRVLFQYSLHPVSQHFYDAQERLQWIDICKQHAEGRKKWEYRASDLPNRHYHHTTRPSYFALGYESITDFKKAVSKEEWDIYCQEHHFCCGIREAVKKPKWFKSRVERSANDYKNVLRAKINKFASVPSKTTD